MIEYLEESIKDVLEEMKPLLVAHYKEVHAFPDKIPFNPDYELYFLLEEHNNLHVLTIRDDGKLVGYIIAFVRTNPHYQDHVYAVNDIIYLDPEYRHTDVSRNMLMIAEDCYRRLGASVITYHMKVSVPFKSLCESVGLEHKENMYMKYIGD